MFQVFVSPTYAAASEPASWWVACIPIAWFVLTGIVNSIAHYATPADVDAWAERNARLAQALSVLRRFGIEPIAGIAAVFGFFAGNPPPPGHAVAIGRGAMGAPRKKPSTTANGFAEVRLLVVVALLACAGCAGLFAAVPVATALGLCVYDYAEQHPGLTLMEYVAQSVVSCGGDALSVIDTILAADNPAVKPYQAEAAELKKAGGERLAAFASKARLRAVTLRGAAP
jgi:hypothetical protein